MNINALIEKHEEACVYAGNWEAKGVLRQFAIELLEMVKADGERTESAPGITMVFAQHDSIDEALEKLRKY
jgi:hypothetical protein